MTLAARVGAMRPSVVRERRATYNLSGGLPPAEAFPVDAIAGAMKRVLDSSSLVYGATEGDAALLERLPPSSLITTGSQQALDLLGKVLVDPGNAVVVESPAYVGALRALALYEPTFVGVPVDAEGLDTSALELQLRDGLRPKLVYLVVNFSNPSGATLSAKRREHLTALREEFGFVVVADDPYGALRFAGEEPPAMSGVVQLGSWSKVLAPALRVGYATVPEWLHRPLVLAKQAADLTSSVLAQRVIADLITDDAWLQSHLTSLREVYRARCDALLDALDERFEIVRPDGGMFVWARIPSDAEAFAARCLDAEVGVVPGNEFAVDGNGFERDVRLSFSQLDAGGLREAGRRMCSVL